MSYMPVDDLGDDMIFDSGAVPPTPNPAQFVGATMHFRRVDPQQQQMALNTTTTSIPWSATRKFFFKLLSADLHTSSLVSNQWISGGTF